MNETKFILASGSPRRIKMMEDHGILPEIIRPDVDETLPNGITMEQAVMYLALKKALHVERVCEKERMILAADTVVYKDRIIGKPRDEKDAFEILSSLRGGMHHVATGVAILRAGQAERTVFCEVTNVFFKDYGDEVIRNYIAGGEVWDKAGGYAIQGGFAPQIDHIEGDYDNVVGFPWKRICGELSEMGVSL